MSSNMFFFDPFCLNTDSQLKNVTAELFGQGARVGAALASPTYSGHAKGSPEVANAAQRARIFSLSIRSAGVKVHTVLSDVRFK